MSNYKKFIEIVSDDANVKAELENAIFGALIALLEAKGLKNEAEKAIAEAFAKTAEAHGLKLEAMEDISDYEL